MFTKQEINQAIEVIKEDIAYIRLFEPNAVNELDMLEFVIVSLEGYRDRDSHFM